MFRLRVVKKAIIAGANKIKSGYQTDKSVARATIEIAAARATKTIATINKYVSIQTCGNSAKTWCSMASNLVRKTSSVI